jgi:lysophospholipase L1-like esterase
MPRERRSKYANDAKDTVGIASQVESLSSSLAQKANEEDVRLKTVKMEMEDLSDTVISAVTGGATVNVLSVPQDDSVSPSKLTQQYKYKGFFNGGDLNTTQFVSDGLYLVMNMVNAPTSDLAFVTVDRAGNYFTQKFYIRNDNNMVYSRNGQYTTGDAIGTVSPWKDTAIPTDLSVTFEKLADSAVSFQKLYSQFDYGGVLASGTDLNNVSKTGGYFIIGIENYLNAPIGITGNYLFEVRTFGNYSIQQITGYDVSSIGWYRTFNSNTKNQSSTWHINKFGVPPTVAGSLTNIDTLTTPCTYIFYDRNEGLPTGVTAPCVFKVEDITDATTGDVNIAVQTVYSIDNPEKEYVRTIRWGIVSPWKLKGDGNSGLPLAGKTIICFGDSITQDADEGWGYSKYIEQRTGARVINCGFGGTSMTMHPDPAFKVFGFPYLMDAKLSGNWSQQQTVLDDWALNGTDEFKLRATAFTKQINKIKNTDFNTLAGITSLYGANDNGATIGETDMIDDTLTYFAGAYNSAIKKVLEAYPKLNIMLITPIFRVFVDPSQDRTLLLVQAVKDVGEFNCLPVYDAYHNVGFNQYNFTQVYSADGLHPNTDESQEVMGAKFAGFISANL